MITLDVQHDSAPVGLTEPVVADDDPVSHSHMHYTTSFVPVVPAPYMLGCASASA